MIRSLFTFLTVINELGTEISTEIVDILRCSLDALLIRINNSFFYPRLFYDGIFAEGPAL
ncbi:hypothetical protein GCM10007978_44070 [Shewanella hanedai]|nr:hypothetical protein GCM10007978_44070 [Shewanella hanedai]